MKLSLLLLSMLAMPIGVHATTLVVNSEETGKFGYRFDGVNSQRDSAEFTFQGDNSDLELSVLGYDVDSAKEVEVLLNSGSLGFLDKTRNNATGPSMFAIPASAQIAGTNSLQFRQKNSGWIWGVTNLLIKGSESNNASLIIGTTETNKFGYRFDGINEQRDSVEFNFQGGNSDLELVVLGYDVDTVDEVEVFLNNSSLGFLAKTQNSATGASSFSIPESSLITGNNSLAFRQKNSGWAWGVTNLLIQEPETDNMDLTIGTTETDKFGYRFDGIFKQRDSADFIFQSGNSDLELSLLGYDVDTVSEIEVFLNNRALGFLKKTANNSTGASSFLIPASLQIPGANSLQFRQTRSGWAWGVSDILLRSSDSIHLTDYELVFSDEFNGASLDAGKWDTGLLWGPYFPINNEEQLYVDTLGMHSNFNHSPFEFTGSTLKITATPTSNDLQPPVRPPEDSSVWQPRPYSEYRYNGPSANGPGYQASDVNYLSGIITSYDSFRMTHGYVEMRAKLPPGRGLWPAFWLLTSHYVEDVPEIDVMEFLGQDVDRLYHTYHYFDIEDNWRKISTPSYATYSADWTQDFHTFGMAWGPTEIIFYVDGVETRRITDQQYTITGQSMYLIANLAVGGNWPGAPDASTGFPAVFEIDYIRAYEKKLQSSLNLAADYQMMFEDNFNGSSLDADKWNTSFLWGPYHKINSEEQYYVDALGADSATAANTPFVLNNGVLSIIAREANDANSFPIPSLPDLNAQVWTDFPTYQRDTGYSPANYTSGIITSYDSFKFVNGYAEMRARIPKGQGLWPAFWLLNGYYVGQQPEIDILEVLGNAPNKSYHSFHRLGVNGLLDSDQGFTDNGDPSVGYADSFHTYGVRWQRGKIDWYIDGNVVYSYTGADVPYQLMYIIVNLAVGGLWPGSPDGSTAFPASLDIDYIRVYQENDPD